MTSTSLTLAVCRTHVKYEPSTWPCSPWVLHSWGVPAWGLGGHRFESCLGFRFFPCPMLLTCWSYHFHNYICAGVSSFFVYSLIHLKYNFVHILVHFHILSFVSIVFVNSCNSALVGCHMIWIKASYLSSTYNYYYVAVHFYIIFNNCFLG